MVEKLAKGDAGHGGEISGKSVQRRSITPELRVLPIDCIRWAEFIIGDGKFGSGKQRRALASCHVASFLNDGLSLYLESHVTFLTPAAGPELALPRLRDSGTDDLLVAISNPRYSQLALDLTRFAREQGMRVLALTEAPTSPLAGLADWALFASARNRLLPNSPIGVMPLANALVTAIAAARPDAVERLKALSASPIWTFHQ